LFQSIRPLFKDYLQPALKNLETNKSNWHTFYPQRIDTINLPLRLTEKVFTHEVSAVGKSRKSSVAEGGYARQLGEMQDKSIVDKIQSPILVEFWKTAHKPDTSKALWPVYQSNESLTLAKSMETDN
jgi:hypothetical protein